MSERGFDFEPLDLLRGHVVRRPHDLPGLGHVRLRFVDESEVQDFHLTVLAQVDVGGLQVAVDDALRVSEGEAVGDLLHDAEDLVDGERSAALDELLEVLALEKLHHHVEVAFFLDEIEDGDDVGMVELRGVAGLTLESLDEIRVGAKGLGDDLERDVAVENRVVAFVDLTHGALADLSDDVVLA